MTASRPTTLSRRTAIVTGSFALIAPLAASRGAVMATQPALAPSGVAIESLCAGEAVTLPGMVLELVRVTVQPGAAFTAQARSGPVAIYVDHGSLDIEVLEGHGRVTRALVDGVWSAQRELSAGDSTYLAAGDRLFHDAATLLARNPSPDRLLLLASTIIDIDAAQIAWLTPA